MRPLAAAPSALAPSAATSELIAYGLLLGGAAVVGKLMIDGLVGDMDAAKARREFIGPIYQPPAEPKDIHVKFGDVVRFVATCASLYSLVAELPSLVSQWGQVEAQVEQWVK